METIRIKFLISILSLLLLCNNCNTVEKFDYFNHVKINEWCSYVKPNKVCMRFTKNKIVISENGILDSIDINYLKVTDSIIAFNVVGLEDVVTVLEYKSQDSLIVLENYEKINPDLKGGQFFELIRVVK
jgi:hypothetical protein